MSNEPYNYGECHVCGEQMAEKLVKMDFWIQGNLIVVEDVPAGVCPQCGEKIVNAKVGKQLSAILENSNDQSATRKITVPVYPFLQKVA
ncbi:MAG TPA: YgiT-type zinc finger protein [Blastocatellia bacterium]|nr:YgiT-type zinc finger protein [Blastocatellia bacterium]